MLDDDQGVAEVLEPDQGLDQPVVVALVQPDRRLVEDVEHTDQPGADLRGEPDALRLAAGQRPRGPVQREVVEADVEQEVEPLLDLLEHPLGDVPLARAELEPAEEVGGLVDREPADLGDAPAADRHGHRHRLQAGTLTDGAGHLPHEALVALAAGVGLRLAVPALDVGAHALEARVVGALASVAVAVPDVDLGRVAVEDRLAGLRGQVLPRGVQVEAELLTQRAHQPDEEVGDVRARPGADRSLAERRRRVGDDQLGVDLHAGAEAVALGAGAERRVEGERARLEVVGLDRVLVGARHLLGEPELAAGVLLGQVDEVEDHQTAGQAERGLHRVGQPALGGLLDREPVDDDLDGVLLLLVQLGRLGERVGLAVDARPGEALGLQLAEQVDVLALAAAHDRGQHLEAPALLQRQDAVDDLLRGLPRDRRAAGRAVRAAGAGVEQPQVVVDLGDRADGRARVLRGRLLVDGDRRGQALDEVDVGLVHLAEELPRVGRERLDVAPLALGEDGVEREARLPGAGQSGEHDQGVAG